MVARFSMPALVAALMLASSPALAALDEAAARSEFEKATKLFEAREYEAALPFYKRAYELSGHRPSAIRALAQCERSLNLYDAAIEHFQEYLATRPEEAPQIVETLAFLQELRSAQEKGRRAQDANPKAKVAQDKAEPATKPSPTPLPAVAPAPAPAPVAKVTEPPVLAATEVKDDKDDRTLMIVLIAVGAAVLVGGGVALGVALSGDEKPFGGSTGAVLRR